MLANFFTDELYYADAIDDDVLAEVSIDAAWEEWNEREAKRKV